LALFGAAPNRPPRRSTWTRADANSEREDRSVEAWILYDLASREMYITQEIVGPRKHGKRKTLKTLIATRIRPAPPRVTTCAAAIIPEEYFSTEIIPD
jgi:hypothetical protein